MAVPATDYPIYTPSTTGTADADKPKPKDLNKPSGGNNSSSSSSGSGSGSSSYAADRRKAGERYLGAARDLQWQIRALKDAINREFRRARRQNIGDLNLMLNQQFDQIKQGAAERGAQFLTAADDAEKATADVQEGGFRNLVRERADSLTAILEQGAGETDAVRAMLMNARNWNANASEANRAYFDTMQSINQGITDLNVDERTSLANAHMYTEGQKELVWQGYYNQRAEALTNLGNTYGKRVELLDQAREMGVGGKGKDKGKGKPLFDGGGVLPGTTTFTDGSRSTSTKNAAKGMKKAFAAASNELGKSYVQKPLPEWIEEFEAAPLQERRQENSNLAAAPTMEGVQRAQGATLRTWA